MIKNYTNKIIIIILLLLQCTLSAKAQMYNQHGSEYIVTNEGDTVKGKVMAFHSCYVLFKAKGANKYLKVDPYKVQIAVENENEFFRSIEFNYDGNIERVFLKELISGDVAFYQFTDSSLAQSYYVKKGSDKFRTLNSSNYNSLRKALLLNCDSIPTQSINITGDYRFNIVADQISMHNARCSSVENPFKVHYEAGNNVFFELKAGIVFTNFIDQYSQFIYTPYYESPNVTGNVSKVYTGYHLGIGMQLPFSKNFHWNPELLYTNFGGSYIPYLSGYTTPYAYIPNLKYAQSGIDLFPARFIFRTNKYKLNPNLCIGAGFRGLFWNKSNLDWSGELIHLGITLGLGFDYEITKRQYIRVLCNYKTYQSGRYDFAYSYFTLLTNSYDITLSYLIH